MIRFSLKKWLIAGQPYPYHKRYAIYRRVFPCLYTRAGSLPVHVFDRCRDNADAYAVIEQTLQPKGGKHEKDPSHTSHSCCSSKRHEIRGGRMPDQPARRLAGLRPVQGRQDAPRRARHHHDLSR